MLWHWRRRIRRAVDLRLGWDLGQRADQVKAEKRLNDERPHFFIVSPTCLSLTLSTATRQARRVGRTAGEQGKRHLEFACSLERLQIEYPLAASEEPCLWKLRSIDGMRCVRCDQCQFGMTSVDSAVERGTRVQGHRVHDE